MLFRSRFPRDTDALLSQIRVNGERGRAPTRPGARPSFWGGETPPGRGSPGRGGAGLGGGSDAHAQSTVRANVRPARTPGTAAAGPLTPRRGEDQDPDKPASPARTRSRGPGDNDQASSSHPQFSLQGILVKSAAGRLEDP